MNTPKKKSSLNFHRNCSFPFINCKCNSESGGIALCNSSVPTVFFHAFCLVWLDTSRISDKLKNVDFVHACNGSGWSKRVRNIQVPFDSWINLEV
jgi:hypothetical protein